MDEASVIPPIIYSTLEPAMVDIHTEIIWCVFGNPLHNTGPFRECFGRFAHRWQRWHVDARDVGISDKKQIADWAEDYAEDSYFFMTRSANFRLRAPCNLFRLTSSRRPWSEISSRCLTIR